MIYFSNKSGTFFNSTKEFTLNKHLVTLLHTLNSKCKQSIEKLGEFSVAWRLEIKQNDLALGCQAVFFANILDHDDDDDINDDEATVSMNAFKHEEVSRLE